MKVNKNGSLYYCRSGGCFSVKIAKLFLRESVEVNGIHRPLQVVDQLLYMVEFFTCDGVPHARVDFFGY